MSSLPDSQATSGTPQRKRRHWFDLIGLLAIIVLAWSALGSMAALFQQAPGTVAALPTQTGIEFTPTAIVPTATLNMTATYIQAQREAAAALAALAPTVTPLSGDRGQSTFDSNRDGNTEIYLTDADGSDPRRLTDDPASDDGTVVELLAPEVVAATDTAAGGLVADVQHYENNEYAISFDYPATWETYSKQDALSVNALSVENMIIGVTEPGSNLNIRMAVVVETGGPDSYSDDQYRDYAQMLDQASPRAMANFEKISDDIITVGGVRALEYVFKYDPQMGTGLDEIRQISVVRNGNAFTLSCGAPVGEFDAVNKDAFDLIVRSFRFE